MGREPSPPRTRVAEIRRVRGLRPVELARRTDMDPSTLWRIESGNRRLTPTFADRLALALMVPVEQLYAPVGTPVPRDYGEAIPPELRPYEPDHAPPAIGQRLRALAADAGIEDVGQLARMIGATEADAIDWMEGRSAPPALLMNRLANRTGVTLAWIYFGDETGLLPGVAARLRRS